MYRFGPGFHHGPGVFGWVLLAAFVVLVVLGIVALVRFWPRLSRPSPLGGWGAPHPAGDPALGELRVRYARGEITWQEFAERASGLGYPVAGTAEAPSPGAPSP